MSKYIATVKFEVGNASIEQEFAARAKGIQYVKEQYHRYTHENYLSVSREMENDHIHKFSDTISQSLVDIQPVDEIDLYGIKPIKML